MRKAVVTGSAGFIGGHLTQFLLNEGWEIIGIDNMSSGLQSTMDLHINKGNFTPMYLDLSDFNHIGKIDSALSKFQPNVVFHLAAISGVTPSVIDPISSNNANITGLLNMLNLSKKHAVERFVFSSSSSVYGGSEELPTKESCDLAPKSPYALQKKVGEEYCAMFSSLYGLDTVSLRYFNVFGPRQRADSAYAAVISSFCHCLKEGLSPTIYGTGEQSRDFCYVDNVVHANFLAANFDGELGGGAFNVGCGGRVSVKSICESIKTKPPIYSNPRPGDVMHSQADISKAKKMLGYSPIVTYEEGIDKTVNWFLDKKL